MEIIQAIQTRRSVRRYKDRAVPPELIRQLIQAARLAPSWANSQTWRFVVVSDEATRHRLAELFKYNRAAEAIKQAPITIVSCSEMGLSGHLRGQKVSDKSWHLFDLGLRPGEPVAGGA
jgi:nitroreductase